MKRQDSCGKFSAIENKMCHTKNRVFLYLDMNRGTNVQGKHMKQNFFLHYIEESSLFLISRLRGWERILGVEEL